MNRTQSLSAVGGAYVIAIAAAVATYVFTSDFELLWRIALADVVGTLVIFAASVRYNNSSLYDAYWSVAPMVIAPALIFLAEPGVTVLRQALLFAVVYWWGARLTFNWARQWSGMEHEDWRYVDIREKTGPFYWLVSLLGIHMFPTFLVFLGCLAMFPALVESTRPLGVLDAVAVAVASIGVTFEMVADRQLHNFRARNPPREEILNEGLWAWSRHPNYFGEVTFWFGVATFGAAADPSAWWVWLGPVSMVALFSVVSLPLIETRMLKRRPHFREHMKKVSMIIPWPPKR